jgi:hypothetical protein
MFNYKAYRYTKKADPALDLQFANADSYGKIRPAETALFWKSGIHWHVISLDEVQRIFRRVEQVYGRLCCGGRNFIIEWLVLVLADGTELVLHIGDDVKKDAEALLEHLQNTHPNIQYGKVHDTPCSET